MVARPASCASRADGGASYRIAKDVARALRTKNSENLLTFSERQSQYTHYVFRWRFTD